MFPLFQVIIALSWNYFTITLTRICKDYLLEFCFLFFSQLFFSSWMPFRKGCLLDLSITFLWHCINCQIVFLIHFLHAVMYFVLYFDPPAIWLHYNIISAETGWFKNTITKSTWNTISPWLNDQNVLICKFHNNDTSYHILSKRFLPRTFC